MTTGGKPRLLGISKRGNKYLRKLLIHGARAALPSLSQSDDAARQMAARPAGAGAQEHGRRRAGEQAGADRLGGAAPRRTFDASRCGGLDTRSAERADRASGRRCLRVVEARWPDSHRRSGTWLKNGARRRDLYEDRDARISILARALPRDRIR